MNQDNSPDDKSLGRWRLVLGKYAERQMPQTMTETQQRMSAALEKLYSREYSGRGVRQGRELGPGSLDPSQLNIPQWLGELRDLFPEETCKRITQHALDRYDMNELVNDPKTLASLEPSSELLATVLMLKGHLNKSVLDEVRKLVRRVVEDIQRRLKHAIQQRITGKRNRFQDSHLKSAANFDAHKTIRRNLKYFDPATGKLIVQTPLFLQPSAPAFAMEHHSLCRPVRLDGRQRDPLRRARRCDRGVALNERQARRL